MNTSSLPPIPSTALLHPSGPTTPNKRVASPVASSSRSAIPRNPSSYSQIVRPKVFQPRPPINGYFTKTTMVDLTIEPEFDGPSVQELGPSGIFKALSKSLRIKWWEKFNYSHLKVNQFNDWFKANIHLQDMTRQEDEAFLLTKDAVMSTFAGASTQQEFNSVVNNVVVNL
ncbi:Retrotransposable element Tf2 [Cucumis melo var. makuwa]|uniref:Retrotransposable element Tf2 n=1 Tax=Cucumis melo var. makuwa TaxID=1194695 RepID=A0A5A7VJ28_CUCMM|nr:Retrotransposable element Tf2 [Cucumis melo var. makuwa]